MKRRPNTVWGRTGRPAVSFFRCRFECRRVLARRGVRPQYRCGRPRGRFYKANSARCGFLTVLDGRRTGIWHPFSGELSWPSDKFRETGTCLSLTYWKISNISFRLATGLVDNAAYCNNALKTKLETTTRATGMPMSQFIRNSIEAQLKHTKARLSYYEIFCLLLSVVGFIWLLCIYWIWLSYSSPYILILYSIKEFAS